jgi:hypothetical protein
MRAAKALIVAVMGILTLLTLGTGLVSVSEYGGPPLFLLFLVFAVAWFIGVRAIIQARRRPDALAECAARDESRLTRSPP